MNLINKSTKFFTLIVASGIITSSALAGSCGGGFSKTEKVARYRTPQMLAFIDSTIDYDYLNRILFQIISFRLPVFVGYLLAAMSQQVKAIKERVWVTR